MFTNGKDYAASQAKYVNNVNASLVCTDKQALQDSSRTDKETVTHDGIAISLNVNCPFLKIIVQQVLVAFMAPWASPPALVNRRLQATSRIQVNA